MTFTELIDYAISRQASDVHITVGTACAIRRFGELEILSDVPTAEESKRMILDSLTEEQTEKVLNGQDLDFALFASNGFRLRANVYHQRNNKAHQIQSTIQSNMSTGMHTLETDLKRLMAAFRISREDALAVANSPKELMMQNSF